jgi:NADH dehydrogenase
VVCADRDGFYRDDGQLIPGDLLVWAAGVKAPDCLRGIGGLTTNDANQLVVRATLQTAQDERIFALGDCASLTPEQGSSALPPTAQVATQQAAHLGRHLGAWLEGRAIPPFAYRDPGASLSLSGYNAFGALGRFGFFKGGIVRGRFAQWSHAMLYRRHQHALHGYARATVLLGAEKLGGLRGPRIRLA